jgi:pimeloyl-ACP methyl ester carboxylesterase
MAALYSINTQVVALAHGPLVYLERGEGDAVVFLHGIGSAARSFQKQFSALAAHWRVLAWNAPGYQGSAGLGHDQPSVDDYANAALAWCDALAVKKFHLIGHSLGALIAARVAASYPQRITSLTLASAAIGHAHLSEDERLTLLRGRLDDVAILGPRGMAEKRGPRLLGPQATKADIRAVVDIMAEIDPRGYAQAAHMLSGGDMLKDVAAVPLSVPVEVIYGSADVITPPEVNMRVVAARSCIDSVVIERAGHALYVEAADQFNAAIEQFIGAHH